MDGFNEYQTGILCGESYIQNIAKLELLLLQKEKMDRRDPYNLVEYESNCAANSEFLPLCWVIYC
jgi:hypothetical protein